VLDAWYGPAVLRARPADRVKVVTTDDGQIIRVARPTLDVLRHTCSVSYQLSHLASGRLIEQTQETHVVRFFFPLELESFLKRAGFELAELSAWAQPGCPPDDSTWSVLVVGRAGR
jgi:hypothetical protein